MKIKSILSIALITIFSVSTVYADKPVGIQKVMAHIHLK